MKNQKWRNNYDLLGLFMDKTVHFSRLNQTFSLRVPSFTELRNHEGLVLLFHIVSLNLKEIKEAFLLWENSIENNFDAIHVLLFYAHQWKEYKGLYIKVWEALRFLLPDIQPKEDRNLWIGDDILLDYELWGEIWEVLFHSSVTEKKSGFLPPQADLTDEAKAYLQKQEENEERIRRLRIKNQAKGGDDPILKSLMQIMYAFPQFTMDYLLNQTFRQILWLKQTAASAIRYEVSANAYAAGNIKKYKFF